LSDQALPSFADLYEALSDRKEQAFVDEYLECLNASLAARRVWGVKASKQKGYKVLRRPDVAAVIAAGLREEKEHTHVDPDRIIRELALVAFADPADLLDRSGKPLPMHRLPHEIRRAIASFDLEVEKVTTEGCTGADIAGPKTTTRTRVVRYKLVPKTPAIELLGKRLKMFSDRLELDASDTLADLIKKAYNRPKEPAT
jgi:phage terminase small subunit